MIYISISPKHTKQVNKDFVNRAVQKVIDIEEVGEVDISFVFETDAFITELNRKYRQINGPTDVLSFDMGYEDPSTGVKYLGDVVISVPAALRQADEHGVSLQSELELLIVHGFLHLLGYDHANEVDQAKMWEAQRRILTALQQNEKPRDS